MQTYRKMVSEVADGVLGKKVRNAARNISKNASGLMERRKGLYNNYLTDRSYENKRGVMKVEKTFNMNKTCVK